MNKKLWNTGVSKLNIKISEYIFSKNLIEDKRLLMHDVFASKAHAKMLLKIGIFTEIELEKICKTLDEILNLGDNFPIEGFEDVHSAIENFLTEKLGEIGKKIHTARSRNDQVLTATRLFMLHEFQNIKTETKNLATKLKYFALKNEFIPMPGFTHMQHAMPSSFGQWAGAFLESLLNDLQCINSAIILINQSPLGSAAGFGTEFPIDRQFTTTEIGFSKTMINSIFCQNSRGKIEVFAMSCLMQIMMTLEKMANDIIIFYSQEFGFLTATNEITTGSSIMPQKRNLDVMEVIRAKSSQVFSNITQITISYHNLISGYNKDMKFTKKCIMESIDITHQSLVVMAICLENIFPNEERMMEVFTKDASIFATDFANNLVMKNGISFRDAYHETKNSLDKLTQINPIESIKSKTHIGSTGNLMINEIYNEIIRL